MNLAEDCTRYDKAQNRSSKIKLLIDSLPLYLPKNIPSI